MSSHANYSATLHQSADTFGKQGGEDPRLGPGQPKKGLGLGIKGSGPGQSKEKSGADEKRPEPGHHSYLKICLTGIKCYFSFYSLFSSHIGGLKYFDSQIRGGGYLKGKESPL